MRGFTEFFNEAIAIARNCDQFGPEAQTRGWWFAGAGSELGCHKKSKYKTLKMKFKENLFGTPGTPTGYWKDGLNQGAGGGPGKAPPPMSKNDIARDMSGAGGGSGRAPQPPQKPNTKGCGGGPSSSECNQKSAGCSGYMCGSKAGSDAAAPVAAAPA